MTMGRSRSQPPRAAGGLSRQSSLGSSLSSAGLADGPRSSVSTTASPGYRGEETSSSSTGGAKESRRSGLRDVGQLFVRVVFAAKSRKSPHHENEDRYSVTAFDTWRVEAPSPDVSMWNGRRRDGGRLPDGGTFGGARMPVVDGSLVACLPEEYYALSGLRRVPTRQCLVDSSFTIPLRAPFAPPTADCTTCTPSSSSAGNAYARAAAAQQQQQPPAAIKDTSSPPPSNSVAPSAATMTVHYRAMGLKKRSVPNNLIVPDLSSSSVKSDFRKFSRYDPPLKFKAVQGSGTSGPFYLVSPSTIASPPPSPGNSGPRLPPRRPNAALRSSQPSPSSSSLHLQNVNPSSPPTAAPGEGERIGRQLSRRQAPSAGSGGLMRRSRSQASSSSAATGATISASNNVSGGRSAAAMNDYRGYSSGCALPTMRFEFSNERDFEMVLRDAEARFSWSARQQPEHGENANSTSVDLKTTTTMPLRSAVESSAGGGDWASPLRGVNFDQQRVETNHADWYACTVNKAFLFSVCDGHDGPHAAAYAASRIGAVIYDEWHDENAAMAGDAAAAPCARGGFGVGLTTAAATIASPLQKVVGPLLTVPRRAGTTLGRMNSSSTTTPGAEGASGKGKLMKPSTTATGSSGGGFGLSDDRSRGLGGQFSEGRLTELENDPETRMKALVECSNYLSQLRSTSAQSVKSVFEKSFARLDELFKAEVANFVVAKRPCTAGTCLVSVLVAGNFLVCANLGDCRAALLSVHKPTKVSRSIPPNDPPAPTRKAFNITVAPADETSSTFEDIDDRFYGEDEHGGASCQNLWTSHLTDSLSDRHVQPQLTRAMTGKIGGSRGGASPFAPSEAVSRRKPLTRAMAATREVSPSSSGADDGGDGCLGGEAGSPQRPGDSAGVSGDESNSNTRMRFTTTDEEAPPLEEDSDDDDDDDDDDEDNEGRRRAIGRGLSENLQSPVGNTKTASRESTARSRLARSGTVEGKSQTPTSKTESGSAAKRQNPISLNWLWLAEEHRASLAPEIKRIAGLGGRIINGRVGGLEPTRTIGDFDVKESQPEGVVSVVPDVRVAELVQPSLLLMATDGIWEFLSPAEISKLIAKHKIFGPLLKKCLGRAPSFVGSKSSPSSAASGTGNVSPPKAEELEALCEFLVSKARKKGSEDDATVVAVYLLPSSAQELQAAALRRADSASKRSGDLASCRL